MKKYIILNSLMLFSALLQGQGLINYGSHIVVSGSTYLVIDGASGNVQNESGVIDLAGILKVGGNFTNNVTNTNAFGTLAAGSEVIFAGTATQTIGGSSTAVFTFDELTINADAIIKMDAGKKLTLNGNLTNNGNFTLAATENDGSATLKISAAIAGTGAYNMETYMTSGRNWYVSSPVTTAKSSVFNAASNPMSWYDEAHGTSAPWPTISNNTTNLDPMKGYIATVSTNGIVTFTGGSYNNSNAPLTVYRTALQSKEGFNLVGNPYPAFYDFGSSLKTNIQPSYWYRAKNAGNTAYVFDTYSVTNGLGTSLSGKSVTANIPPMQAFWVRVDDGQSSGTISFDKQYVNHSDLASNRRRSPNASSAKYVRLQVSNGYNYDETILVFNPLASDGYDAYDSPKMSNGSTAIPEIYSKAGNETVAINGMKAFETEKNVALGFNTAQSNSFTIKATEITGFDAGYKIVLYDDNLKTEYDLTANTAYQFSSSEVNTLSRFEVRFKAPGITTDITENAVELTRFVRNNNNQITLHYSGQPTGNEILSLYNTAGIMLNKKQILCSEISIDMPYPAGVYVLKAQIGAKIIANKITIK